MLTHVIAPLRRHALATVVAAALALWAPGARAQDDPEWLRVPERPASSAPSSSSSELAGLRELEGELERFDRRLTRYRTDLDRTLCRRVATRRRALLERYAAPLRAERGQQAEARDAAIDELREFVRQHPNAAPHTPGAFLRLAELELASALERAGSAEPDLAPTIRAARDAARFRDYASRDRALYLLGWALAETGATDASLLAYRRITCAELYDRANSERPAALEGAGYPAVRRDSESSRYEGCAARVDGLATEVWLRIGEQHFDRGELRDAIAAYRRVASQPAHALYAFGLYKLAWSHYRDGDFAQAIERFAALVDHSDDVRARTGRDGSDLRAEALQYIALSLAWDDWDEDGRPDHATGGAHPLERLEDGATWPLDRPWAADVYRRVGEILHEEGQPEEAILAWRLRLARFPGGCDRADVALSIASAHRQLGQDEEALAAIDRLARLEAAPGCPAMAGRVAELTRAAVRQIARVHHRRAQVLRRRAEVDSDAAAREAALAEYGRAIDAYDRALETSGAARHDAARLALELDRAEALLFAGRHDEAASAFGRVRDATHDPALQARAARRVVVALRWAAEAAGADVREELPAAGVGPMAVPLEWQRIARAREIYARWVQPENDAEHLRDGFAHDNAALLASYGFTAAAERRFGALYRERCRGAHASSAGQRAWLALYDLAAARNDAAAAEALTRSVAQRRCTFAPTGPAVVDAECAEGGASLACELPRLQADLQLRRLSAAARALEGSDSPRSRATARGLAAELLAVAQSDPGHVDAAAAMLLAAELLERHAGRGAEARLVYRRVLEQASRGEGAGDARLVTMARAHFGLGRAAQRAFEYTDALAAFAVLADSERFVRSADEEVRELRVDALHRRARLSAALGRHADAATQWAELAAATRVPALAREARLAEALEHLAAGRPREAATRLRAWVAADSAGDGESMLARWSLAEVSRGAERVRALEATVSAFAAHGRRPDLAARAALAQAEEGAAELAPIRVPRRASVDEAGAALGAAIAERSAAATREIEALERALSVGHAPTSIRALRLQGEVYEALVRVALAAEVSLPRDLSRRLARAPRAARAQAERAFADAIAARLDERVRPLECRAIDRYALSARLGTRASLPSPDGRRARERLAAYGEERVRGCLAEARRRDPSFPVVSPSELAPVREGLHPPGQGENGPATLEH